MTDARSLTFSLLRRWTKPSDPPFLPERSDDTFAQLSPRDRAFAFDLLTGILRWRGALDAVIASRLKQPLDQIDLPVRALLWLGSYQLLFQRGTSDYAAVDTTVNLARQNRDTNKAAGLVNAILRNITRLQPATAPRNPALSRRTLALDFDTDLVFNEDIFANPQTNPIGHLAAVRSHPAPFVDHLRNILGQSQASELLLRNNLRPVITLRSDSASLDVPAAAGLVAHAEESRFLVASEGWNPTIEALVSKGVLSPQDPTAAKPVRAAADLITQNNLPAPKNILDLCAGLGTKTIQLARTFPEVQVTAADIDTVKLSRLALRAKQVGQTNIVTAPSSEIENQESRIKYDLILVDVPCSNTGVMSKRVQSRWRWPSLDRAALEKLQLQLLTQAAQRLAPQGLLIYSTCSIDPAENDQLIQKYLSASKKSLHLLHSHATLPSLTTRNDSTHDGGFFAVLSHP